MCGEQLAKGARGVAGKQMPDDAQRAHRSLPVRSACLTGSMRPSRLRVPSGKMCTHSPSARRDCGKGRRKHGWGSTSVCRAQDRQHGRACTHPTQLRLASQERCCCFIGCQQRGSGAIAAAAQRPAPAPAACRTATGPRHAPRAAPAGEMGGERYRATRQGGLVEGTGGGNRGKACAGGAGAQANCQVDRVCKSAVGSVAAG